MAITKAHIASAILKWPRIIVITALVVFFGWAALQVPWQIYVGFACIVIVACILAGIIVLIMKMEEWAKANKDNSDSLFKRTTP